VTVCLRRARGIEKLGGTNKLFPRARARAHCPPPSLSLSLILSLSFPRFCLFAGTRKSIQRWLAKRACSIYQCALKSERNASNISTLQRAFRFRYLFFFFLPGFSLSLSFFIFFFSFSFFFFFFFILKRVGFVVRNEPCAGSRAFFLVRLSA